MKNLFIISILICTFQVYAQSVTTPKLPYCYDELTAPDFIKAVELSAGVCLLPIGILEKHGPHLPLGTDIFECRKVATSAASQE